MKKTGFFLLYFVIPFFGWTQQEGVRTLSLSPNWPKELRISVTITIIGEAGEITVVERPPEGWTIRSINNEGLLENGTITWNASISNADMILTRKYTLALPDNLAAGDFHGSVNGKDIGGVLSFHAEGYSPGVQMPVRSGLKYNYLLYLPPSFAEEGAPLPLLMFLHGIGERGDNIDLVKSAGPSRIVEDASFMRNIFKNEEFPFILVSPQCPYSKWWENQSLMDVFNQVSKNFPVDRNRIYITGLSMGGFGSWCFASQYPEMIAALLPIASGDSRGDAFLATIRNYYAPLLDNFEPANPETLTSIPIWSFHGDRDSTVPIELDRQLVDQINALGGNAKLTVYPGVDHDSWAQTYNNPEVYQWLLSHSKKEETQVLSWELYR